MAGAPKRVLVCDAIPAEAVERMRAGGLSVDESIGLSDDALAAAIGEYDALVVRSATKVRARHLAAGKRLKVIVRGGVGVDNIDVAAAEAEGVRVMNTPSASSASVAELALALMFALARQIPRADASMKSGAWDKKSFAKGMELEGKTLGILGVGRIGRSLARKASAIGMVVIGADPALGTTGTLDGLTLLPPDDVYARAEVISLHVPRPPGTRAVIGREEIEKMKPGVFLVNCARGGVVDEEALLAALSSGKVAGAALDVFEVEPPKDLRLVSHPRVIATPHVGASTVEAQNRVGDEVAEILLAEL
ncbi:MAG TPA: hydroxyacid dehydrogenase [Candidatus Polarisedimenticolaceae bacterium]|nr:hydroxyacid dehydrogenase [Candidatus Polarisedimenticolaceae bacterium]